MPAPQEFGQEFDDAPSPWRPVGVNDIPRKSNSTLAPRSTMAR